MSLIEITPNKLFIEHSVKEIQDIDKKIQIDIEKKRQELRCMVGERYRDVLTTADTIQSMKCSAKTFKKHIHLVKEKCVDIHSEICEQQAPLTSVNKLQYFVRSIAIQIKILILIPEIIWTCLDGGDYLKAVQIYLFANYMYTGLELDTEHKVLEKFPILSRLKLSIRLFRNRIQDGIQTALMNVNLSSQEASDHVCAYMLLENKSLEQSLKYFFDMRHTALLHLLNSTDVMMHNAVRCRIITLIQCLTCTIDLFHSCFVENLTDKKKFLAKSNLEYILKNDGDTVINMLHLEEPYLLSYIPAVIRQYQPSCKQFDMKLSADVLNAHMDSWLTQTSHTINDKLFISLKHVMNVKVLHHIKEESTAVIADVNREYLPKDFNVWDYFIQPLISKRAEFLILQINEHNTRTLFDKIRAYLDVRRERTGAIGVNDELGGFVWTEELEDGGKESTNLHDVLVMQTKGYSPQIVELCRSLDTVYLQLLQNVCLYLSGTTDFTDQHSHQQTRHLISYLKDEGNFNVYKLINDIDDEILKGGKANILTGARLFQAIASMCPHLKTCCSTASTRDDWDNIVERLHERYLRYWDQWLEDTKAQLECVAKTHLLQTVSFLHVLDAFPKWEAITIEEQVDDSTIKSQIKLPTHPSVCLVNLLSTVLGVVDVVVPHTVPRPVYAHTMDMLVSVVLQHYERLASNDELSQNLAIQLLLDVKFLTTICIRRDCSALASTSQKINDTLRSRVDPFDLNVFYVYLQSCIKQSVLQMNVLLGCFLGATNQLSNIGTQEAMADTSGGDVEPSVLPCSSDCAQHNETWFPLLPVTVPGAKNITLNMKGVGVGDRPANPSVSTMPPSLQHSSTTSNSIVRSGAAALLADWFS